MIPRPSLLPLITLLVLVVAAESSRLAFHFDGKNKAGCSSSTYNIELGAVEFVCDGGQDLCRAGEKAVLTGWFNSHTALPVDMTQRIKVCKYFGSMCTGVLNYTADTLRNDWNLYALYGNVTYPNPGHYAFEKPFIWPNNRLSDFPWAGLKFDIVVDIQADDTGDEYHHLRCHAPFTTVNFDTFKESGSTGSGFAARFGGWSVSMIGVVGLGAVAFRRKKRRQPILTLDGPIYPEEESGCTAFEMMTCSHTDGEIVAVRV